MFINFINTYTYNFIDHIVVVYLHGLIVCKEGKIYFTEREKQKGLDGLDS